MAPRANLRWLLYGFLLAPIGMLVVLIYSIFLGRSNEAFVDVFCTEQACECGDWYRRSVGNLQVENNVWNRGSLKSYQQCVSIAGSNDGVDAGWAWNWPGIRFNVVAYPNITFGKNPWLGSTTLELPRQLKDVKCLEAKVDISQIGTGKGNLSFDIWITRSLLSQPADITHEAMIWLSQDGTWPAGSRVETLIVDEREIELWWKEKHSPSDEYQWSFLAFEYKDDFNKGTIRIHEFLNFLVTKGYISSDNYLASVELGNEIVSGHGQTLLRDYEVQFCEDD